MTDKKKNPLYHPRVASMSGKQLVAAARSATGIDRQRVDFEIAHRMLNGSLKVGK